MSNNFDYIIDKINNTEFSTDPYKYVLIEDLFSDEHFENITKSVEINIDPVSSDNDLFDELYSKGYKIVEFPGCITNKKQYISWHKNKTKRSSHTACEGFGVTLRLYNPRSKIITEINEFLKSEKFNRCLAEKFGINYEECNIDGGIQKYLDGYEISPHSDIRRKAATFMININPSKQSEKLDYHTRYLTFSDKRKYVQTLWEGNENIDRCWVPWDWCEVEFRQTKNNSMVIFSPNNDTMHAIKASYDHLSTQRTQLYGNLWYKKSTVDSIIDWEDLDLLAKQKKNNHCVLKDTIPAPIKKILKPIKSAINDKKTKNIGKRKY